VITVSIPIGIARMSSASATSSATSHASASLSVAMPARFWRTVPGMSCPSCSTTPSWRRTDPTSSELSVWSS
jgi:hypothetical protein